MKLTGSQSGAALLTVLSVLGVMAVVVALIMNQGRSDIGPWSYAMEKTQASYLAESAIAYQLYLEKYSDSSEPSFSPRPKNDSDSELGLMNPPSDTFNFRLDSSLIEPTVTVDRNRAYLEMAAVGQYRKTSVTIHARYGKALDDSLFGPAFTLQNTVPLETFSPDHIKGKMRMKIPTPNVSTLPWADSLNVVAYASSFTDSKYNGMEALLQKKLSAHDGESGEGGNGNFSSKDPPDFSKKGEIIFPLGQVEIMNDEDKTWVIKGPGKIFADGDIRIRGNIVLDHVQLYSSKNITFEDSVSGTENIAYARKSIFFHDRCNLGIDALARKEIVLRDHSQTTMGSVLICVGNNQKLKAADSLNAIRVVNEAVGRGFLIAAGPNGRVVVGTPANVVEGVIIASAVWLAGEVHGTVLTQKFLCEGTNTKNCLGSGKIDRSRLPEDFVQPLQLGSQNRKLYTFKLLDWQRL